MKNLFAETYEKVIALNHRYEVAATVEEKDEIRSEYNAAMKPIEDLGNVASYIWNEYFNSIKNGNVTLNLHDNFSESYVQSIINCIRENGIEKFTFSSSWSSAVDVAWLFLKNGCTLIGLVEINGNKGLFKEQHEKLHAYLFKVN